MCEQLATITQIWQSAKCYFTHMSNTSVLKTVPDMNKITASFSEVSQQTLKRYEQIAIISQIWHRAKFYFTCMSNQWYLIMAPNMKESHHEGKHEVGWTDGRTDG